MNLNLNMLFLKELSLLQNELNMFFIEKEFIKANQTSILIEILAFDG